MSFIAKLGVATVAVGVGVASQPAARQSLHCSWDPNVQIQSQHEVSVV